MIGKPIGIYARLILGVVSLLFIVGFYYWLSWKQHLVNPRDTTIPNFSQIWNGGVLIFEKGWFFVDFYATFKRYFISLSVGISISVILGIAMGSFSIIDSIFKPPLTYLEKIPPTAMIAVFFAIFGTDFRLYVAMIGFGILPILAQSIANAVQHDVPQHYIDKAYTLGASDFEVIWNVIVKQILPRIIEGIKLQLGPAMVYLIAAEWMLADEGIGYRLRIQSRLLNMSVVYIYLLFLGILGFCMSLIISRLNLKICPWFEKD